MQGDRPTQEDLDVTRAQMTLEDVMEDESIRVVSSSVEEMKQSLFGQALLGAQLQVPTGQGSIPTRLVTVPLATLEENDRILESRTRQLQRSRKHHDQKNDQIASLERLVEELRRERLSLLEHLAKEREWRRDLEAAMSERAGRKKQPDTVVLHQVIPIDPARSRVVLSYEGDQIVVRVGGN